MYDSQSSHLLPMHYRHGFHSRLGDLNMLLRYFLGNLLLTRTSDVLVWYEHFCRTLCIAAEVGLYHTLGAGVWLLGAGNFQSLVPVP